MSLSTSVAVPAIQPVTASTDATTRTLPGCSIEAASARRQAARIRFRAVASHVIRDPKP